MKVAVVGGTGVVGRQVVQRLGPLGHEAVVVARSAGIDVTTGVGLDEVLQGVDAVVDVINTPARVAAETEAFFSAETAHLLAAGHRGGVGHHVLLSIVGIDRVESNPHYAGKRSQERLVEQGPVPWSPFTDEMAGDVLLPGPAARIGSITFDERLRSQGSVPA
jgi:uncharacterized protein YbjT (DUF2867 family)